VLFFLPGRAGPSPLYCSFSTHCSGARSVSGRADQVDDTGQTRACAIDPVLNAIASCWISGNSAWMRITQRTAWDVAGIDALAYRGWYMVNCNTSPGSTSWCCSIS